MTSHGIFTHATRAVFLTTATIVIGGLINAAAIEASARFAEDVIRPLAAP